jgi:hypothetical protein
MAENENDEEDHWICAVKAPSIAIEGRFRGALTVRKIEFIHHGSPRFENSYSSPPLPSMHKDLITKDKE